MKPNENYELERCRDYKEECMTLEKKLYDVEKRNGELLNEVAVLKETIVNMTVARYLKNEL